MAVKLDTLSEEEDAYQTPNDFTDFLEFTNRLNIPLNEEYFRGLKATRLVKKSSLSQTLSVFEHGIKDGRYLSSEFLLERRLQNALWRAWWRQTRARFHGTYKEIPEGENIVEEALPEIRTLHICGADIGDFPTEYTIPALKPHEIPVVGTYIGRKVLPGFTYRVRLNGSPEYLFEGKPLVLKSVGKGYGKRLTFHSGGDDDNDNFFWSDSNSNTGFAFSVQVIFKNDNFEVIGPTGLKVADVRLTNVSEEQEIQEVCLEEGVISMIVAVDMDCTFTFPPLNHVPECFQGHVVELPVSGLALTRRAVTSWKAETVVIQDVPIPDLGVTSFHLVD